MRYRTFALCLAILGIAGKGLAITRSWTGATSASWSVASNWSPSGVPSPSDSLIFPAGVVQTTMTNDLPAGTSFGPMNFRIGYTLNGNPLTLTGDLSFDQSTNPNFVCHAELKLGAAVTLGAAITSHYNGAIDVNGQTLTIDSYNTVLSGAIKGTGAIVVTGSGISLTGGGTFSGTITGTIDVTASMPNLTYAGGGALSGNGAIGEATITSFALVNGLLPGSKLPCCNDPHSIGTLSTKSISMGGPMYVDLTSGAYDQLQVSGSVTLGGKALHVSVPSGFPAPGQSFTIIDNDGVDAISGTFAGLPEGAQIDIGGATVTISYHGGSGNDVVLTTASSTKRWTGANSGLWSDPGNWSPAAIPSAGEDLLFPAGVTRTTMTNDLPAGTSFGAMDFRTGYTLNGNPLTLTGDLSFDQSTNPNFVCHAGLKLGAAVTLGAAITSHYNGAIDVNGQTLTIDSYNTVISGAINGTGAIVVAGSGVSLAGGGTFSGTITGTIDVTASMPNVTYAGGGALSGNGAIGAATITSFPLGDGLFLGSKLPCCNDPHSVGTLSTKSISMGGPMHVDLTSGAYDQLQVSGSVALGGKELHVSVPSGFPAPGQSFTIIDNDGSDAISGTFAGLPEGAQIDIGGATVTISYHGGSGNDVVLTTASSTKRWTGANSGLWSDPGNWSPAAIPSAGEDLLFPAGATRTTMTNDLPAGTSFGPMDFRIGYTLNGNPLTLTGDLSFDQSTNPNFVCHAELKLGAAVTLGAAITSHYIGAIDVNGQTLTIDSYNTVLSGAINGTGAIVVNGSGVSLAGGGTFSGTITGTIDVTGSMPNATYAGGGALSGNGAIGEATITSVALVNGLLPGSKLPCCNDPHSIGTLSTKSISMGGPMYVDLTSGAYDQLQVSGSVTLGGKTLHVSVPGGSPAAGDTFTIIDNDGNDPIAGTFENLPDGALLSLPPWKFRIDYHGGDGNDVALIAVDDTETASGQDKATTRLGEAANFTATVTSRVLVPSGQVTFTDNGAILQTLPLVGGKASLAYSALDAGVHAIAAVYNGTPIFAPSASSLSHEVLRGHTTTALSLTASSVLYGNPSSLQVSVGAVAPATGVPSGGVALEANGVSIGSAVLAQGTASLPSVLLDAGTYAIAAAYAGDARFEPSASAGSSLTVLKAPTSIEAGSSATETAVMLTISVIAPHRPALPVAGVVTVSEGGAILAQQPVSGGPAVVLLALPTGDHQLVVSYPGSANFEASSATIAHTVAQPQVSVGDVVVAEGDIGETAIALSIELSTPTPDFVTVSYSVESGTASEGEDYRRVDGTITFSPGETLRTIALPIYGDTKPEDDETLRVTLTAPANATLGRSIATVTIRNDDVTWHAANGLVYASAATGPLTLDLYTPIEGAGPFPLIVWIPGAQNYDAAGSETPALRQTARGYAVASVRYRAAGVAPFPAQLEDLQGAIRWLRANASQYRIDAQRIAVWGSSAGAHLASLAGTRGDASSRVQAVIDRAGAAELLRLQSDAAAASCATNYDAATSPQSLLLGCAIQTCPAAAAAASPLSFVSPDDPPFLIVHGDADCGIPPAQSRRLYDALRAAGVAATLRSAATEKELDAFIDANLSAQRRRRAAAH